jgi:hypothetical protein
MASQLALYRRKPRDSPSRSEGVFSRLVDGAEQQLVPVVPNVPMVPNVSATREGSNRVKR